MHQSSLSCIDEVAEVSEIEPSLKSTRTKSTEKLKLKLAKNESDFNQYCERNFIKEQDEKKAKILKLKTRARALLFLY